jgi:Xaa-Pro aminopeptidase
MIQNRISKLREKMGKQRMNALLVSAGENRRYLSGFTGEDTQFDESAGALLITEDALVLATDSRYEIQAKTEAPFYEVVCYKTGLAKELPSLLKKYKTRRLGFEARRISFDMYSKIKAEVEAAGLSLELIEQADMVEKIRLIKEENEVAAIRKAVDVAETAFQSFLPFLRPGLGEAQAAWALEKRMRMAGAQSLSFPVIAAFSKNSALPHAIPCDRVLEAGVPVLFDWGAKLNGYCSDMTRTLVLGKQDAFFEKIFTIVYDAQQKAIAAIQSGVASKKIDAIARDHIAAQGFGENFGHGLGHGVGLAIHEAPSISPLAEKSVILEENMVFTVEPGIYLPDWGGIRLENLIRVTQAGAEVLNRLDIRIRL